MISTEELKQRILSELEEAGDQETITLLNTVIDFRKGDTEELVLFRNALLGLIDAGLVSMAPENVPGKRLVKLSVHPSRQLAIDRLDGLHFVEDDLSWTRSPFIYSYVVATEAGMARARQILTERGYEWWYYEDETEPSR